MYFETLPLPKAKANERWDLRRAAKRQCRLRWPKVRIEVPGGQAARKIQQVSTPSLMKKLKRMA